MRPFWADPEHLVGELVRVRVNEPGQQALARVVGHDEAQASGGPWILRVLNGERAGVLSRGWHDHDIEPAGIDSLEVEVGDGAPDGSATPYNRRHALLVDVARGQGQFAVVAARLRHGTRLREIAPAPLLAELLYQHLECDYGDQLRHERYVGYMELLRSLAGDQQEQQSLATRIARNLPRERPELQERLQAVRGSIAELGSQLSAHRSR